MDILIDIINKLMFKNIVRKSVNIKTALSDLVSYKYKPFKGTSMLLLACYPDCLVWLGLGRSQART
jgi:hypothetical protein